MARTKAFNPEEKLTIAMMLFWEKGYDGTSMQDLVSTMEVNRFSIYNTFGDKEALFFKALQHYGEHVFTPLLIPLMVGDSGMCQIEKYFENLSQRLAGLRIKAGCFLQNAIQEAAVDNPEVRPYVVALFHQMHNAFRLALEEGKRKAEFTDSLDIKEGTEFLIMQVQALIVMQKQVPPERLLANTKFMLSNVRSW